MYGSVRVQGFGFLCSGVLIAWLNFIEPISTYLALDKMEWLPTVALACSLSAGLLGAACAIFVIWDIKHSEAVDGGLSVARHTDAPLVPIQIGLHVGATLAAGNRGSRSESLDVISPSIAADSE